MLSKVVLKFTYLAERNSLSNPVLFESRPGADSTASALGICIDHATESYRLSEQGETYGFENINKNERLPPVGTLPQQTPVSN
jgi:hypothetical protein